MPLIPTVWSYNIKIDIALEPEYSAAELAELADLAERNGIATIWVTNDSQARDLFMLFSKVAGATQTIRLGVMAVSPFEVHPIKLAAALATLNEMSNGRASLVVGAADRHIVEAAANHKGAASVV